MACLRNLFVRCPADQLESTARAIARLPEVRAVGSMIGPDNLYVGLWLRSLEDAQKFESQLSIKVPYVTITDRSLVLRPIKQFGALLDEDGRRVGIVPMDMRARPASRHAL